MPLVVRLVRERLGLLESELPLPWLPENLVREGYCDPVRVFVKQEPHTAKKMAEGRMRLIWSVSIVDQIIDRLLFTNQINEELESWKDIPSCPGFGFATDDQIREFLSRVWGRKDFGAYSDVSAWDVSMQEYVFTYGILRYPVLSGAGRRYTRLCLRRAWCMMRKVIALSSGRMYSQVEPGVMASGFFPTLSDNSFDRGLLIHWVASLNGVVDRVNRTQGDDALENRLAETEEESFARAAKAYALVGVTLKEFKHMEGSFVFCSHRWSPSGALAENWHRSFFRLLHHKDLVEGRVGTFEVDLLQFCREMRFCPELPKMLEVLGRVVVTAKSWREKKVQSSSAASPPNEGGASGDSW